HRVCDSATCLEGTSPTVRLPPKHFGGSLGDLQQGEAMTQGRTHDYHATIRWTGNLGTGTATYAAYGRDYRISVPGKPDLDGSADARFRGDATRHNPEDLLVAALSACHMLAYLALCARLGVKVTGYIDEASGTL